MSRSLLSLTASLTIASGLSGCTQPTAPSGRSGAAATSSAVVPSAPATQTAACPPWGGRGFSLATNSYGGLAANFTKLEYDDATGTLTVHHSMPTGTPSTLEKTIVLTATDRDAVARDLLALCPDDKERAERCAPGGCQRIEVRPVNGVAQSLENGKTAHTVTARLRGFFPELAR